MDFRADFEKFCKDYPVQSVRINELTFNYRFGGNGDKALVLLVGGLGISDAFFNHFRGFVKSFKVLTFDYPMETNSNSVLADAIAELIKSLKLHNVFLVGQSYGGFIAQVIAKRHPEIVSGLILSNTGCLAADMDEETKGPMLDMIKRLKKAALLTRLVPIALLRGEFIKKLEEHLVQCTPEEKKYMSELFRYVIGMLTNRHERHMCSLMIDLINELDSTKESYSYLDGRVLLLLSEDDDTFSDAIKQSLIRLMPNPVVNTKISGGHLALLLRIELYIHTVTEFVNSI